MIKHFILGKGFPITQFLFCFTYIIINVKLKTIHFCVYTPYSCVNKINRAYVADITPDLLHSGPRSCSLSINQFKPELGHQSSYCAEIIQSQKKTTFNHWKYLEVDCNLIS